MGRRRPPKRHLAWTSRPPVHRAACGLAAPRSWTFTASEVTCVACMRTIKMADAEVAERINSKRSNV